MKNTLISLVLPLAIFSLTACGGGGSDSTTSPTPAAPLSGTASEAEIRGISTLSATITEITNSVVAYPFEYTGGFLAYLTTPNTTSAQTVSIACTTGSGTATVTKASPHDGWSGGDQIALNYVQCANAFGAVQNGLIKIAVQRFTKASGSLDFSLTFDADLTAYSFNNKGDDFQYDGSVSVSTETANSFNSVIDSLEVPSGKSLNVVGRSGGTDSLSLTYIAGLAAVNTFTKTPSKTTAKLDGSVSATVANQPPVTLTLAMPSALTGTTSTSNTDIPFSPTSGVINTTFKNSDGRLVSAATTITGQTVAVGADSDGNGSLDLNFSTTWAALLAP